MEPLKLLEYRHPNKDAFKKFEALVGIDQQKNDLLFTLQNLLDKKNIIKWMKKHHPKGIPSIENTLDSNPLVILCGDVGCGKTALAQSICSPLSHALGGETVILFETPSNIRGGGHVGELSNRITAAFDTAKSKLRKGEYGVLLIDEADDLATNRDQMQAHHEDRSGVNVLIKEIDKIKRENIPLAVILITNRLNAIDPAVLRRSILQLKFDRPNSDSLPVLIKQLFEGVKLSSSDIETIVKACNEKKPSFNYSDLFNKLGRQCLISAWRDNVPITKKVIVEVISRIEPSPIFKENSNL